MQEQAKNPFVALSNKQKNKDRASTVIFAGFTYFVLACALFIFGKITYDGAPVLFKAEAPFVNTDFLFSSPETLVEFTNEGGLIVRMDSSDFRVFKEENPAAVIRDEHTFSYSGGGIWGPLVGTALLVVVCMVVSLFVGVSAAIYLNEYAGHGRLVGAIRLAIMNLAGVPSIVYGLFGFAFFCLAPWFPVLTYEVNPETSVAAFKVPFSDGFLSFQGWGNSLIAGGMTLAVMALPVIIAACEESLKAVPKGFREASLALGATKWQMIRTAVLPYALPGILTASILGVTRVAGETAPIMFTAAVADKAKLPWEEANGSPIFWFSDMFTQSVQALPYHIYTVSARIPDADAVRDMRYGSVFVFLLLVMGFAMISIVLRAHYRAKIKW
ncbi:phosphate ABC transporter permease PstA [bacterium]|nr:phosphate ABC transporter permease PstA [bacterium]